MKTSFAPKIGRILSHEERVGVMGMGHGGLSRSMLSDRVAMAPGIGESMVSTTDGDLSHMANVGSQRVISAQGAWACERAEVVFAAEGCPSSTASTERCPPSHAQHHELPRRFRVLRCSSCGST